MALLFEQSCVMASRFIWPALYMCVREYFAITRVAAPGGSIILWSTSSGTMDHFSAASM